MRKCGSAHCRSLWIDPVIAESELHQAYATYYTHSEGAAAGATGGCSGVGGRSRLSGIYDRLIKRKYWALFYGYGNPSESVWRKLPGLLVCLVPNRAFYLNTHIMFLKAVPGGRVLDVGCGNGERLELLRSLGWLVQGVDFDETAVQEAKRKGLDVECGELLSVGYLADSFDAVISSHVIEHVPEPTAMLEECARILKPGGRLVLVTPNAESFGLSYFGRCWRGLEPPRHLQIFSLDGLKCMVQDAGLKLVSAKTLLAPQILSASEGIRTGAPLSGGSPRLSRRSTALATSLTLWEWMLLRVNPRRGEVLAVIATK